MAEATLIEERPIDSLPRFYCHMCNVEINIRNRDFICPHCSGGFVEELPATLTTPIGAPSSLPSQQTTAGTATPNNGGMRQQRTSHPGDNQRPNMQALRRDITAHMIRNMPNMRFSFDGGPPLPLAGGGGIAATGGGTGGARASGPNGGVSGSSGATAGGRVRQSPYDHLDNLLFDFMQSLTGGDPESPFGVSQISFLGNPGDYAWGMEGIDAIVTQLLNQMETSGPPPLAKDKIESIPKVQISAEEVGQKLQCSVCWEDFQLDETVRKLPCTHVYHENCIVPWLDLHGTCPICRKTIDDGDSQSDCHCPRQQPTTTSSDAGATVETNTPSDGGGNGVAAATEGTTAASSTETGNNASQNNRQNQTFYTFLTFDDSNDDLD